MIFRSDIEWYVRMSRWGTSRTSSRPPCHPGGQVVGFDLHHGRGAVAGQPHHGDRLAAGNAHHERLRARRVAAVWALHEVAAVSGMGRPAFRSLATLLIGTACNRTPARGTRPCRPAWLSARPERGKRGACPANGGSTRSAAARNPCPVTRSRRKLPHPQVLGPLTHVATLPVTKRKPALNVRGDPRP